MRIFSSPKEGGGEGVRRGGGGFPANFVGSGETAKKNKKHASRGEKHFIRLKASTTNQQRGEGGSSNRRLGTLA